MFNILNIFKNKIILGIHGINNKPPKNLLEKWWKSAIIEGLKNIKKRKLFLNFRLAYWADYFYEQSENPDIKNPEDPFFIKYPYIKGGINTPTVSENHDEKRKRLFEYLEKKFNEMVLDDKSFINLDFISDMIIKKIYKDIFIYYNGRTPVQKKSKLPAKIAVRNELANLIRKYKNKKVMLIAHSLGSVIAYDSLMMTIPDIEIDTLITIGSPLGLPVIKRKIMSELKLEYDEKSKLPTPDNIKNKWYNFSDLKDKTALQNKLHLIFDKNKYRVHPIDKIIVNNYIYKDQVNPHKSYGYLRNPEIAKIISNF